MRLAEGIAARLLRKLARRTDFELRPRYEARADYGEFERATVARVKPYTMTSHERIVAVIDAARYVVRARLPGAMVECGVWRGGCTMAAALTFLASDDIRDLYLFDTFAGMTAPTEVDRTAGGVQADAIYRKLKTAEGSDWCNASVEEVHAALASTGYPMERVHLVKGKVEDTLPARAPGDIALLRLDTDWYESTKHELTTLYPRLVSKGVLIIDDYGHWEGSRRAVDEYLRDAQAHLLLARTDHSGRLAIKV